MKKLKLNFKWKRLGNKECLIALLCILLSLCLISEWKDALTIQQKWHILRGSLNFSEEVLTSTEFEEVLISNGYEDISINVISDRSSHLYDFRDAKNGICIRINVSFERDFTSDERSNLKAQSIESYKAVFPYDDYYFDNCSENDSYYCEYVSILGEDFDIMFDLNSLKKPAGKEMWNIISYFFNE